MLDCLGLNLSTYNLDCIANLIESKTPHTIHTYQILRIEQLRIYQV